MGFTDEELRAMVRRESQQLRQSLQERGGDRTYSPAPTANSAAAASETAVYGSESSMSVLPSEVEAEAARVRMLYDSSAAPPATSTAAGSQNSPSTTINTMSNWQSQGSSTPTTSSDSPGGDDDVMARVHELLGNDSDDDDTESGDS